jgi:hypothetical protein
VWLQQGESEEIKINPETYPVVDGEVRDTVVLDDFSETSHLLTKDGEEGEHADEESIGNEHIGSVTGVENEGFGVEVVGPGRVPGLARSVGEEVSGPSEELRGKLELKTDRKDARIQKRTC